MALLHLPVEILLLIARDMCDADVYALRETCKQLRDVADETLKLRVLDLTCYRRILAFDAGVHETVLKKRKALSLDLRSERMLPHISEDLRVANACGDTTPEFVTRLVGIAPQAMLGVSWSRVKHLGCLERISSLSLGQSLDLSSFRSLTNLAIANFTGMLAIPSLVRLTVQGTVNIVSADLPRLDQLKLAVVLPGDSDSTDDDSDTEAVRPIHNEHAVLKHLALRVSCLDICGDLKWTLDTPHQATYLRSAFCSLAEDAFHERFPHVHSLPLNDNEFELREYDLTQFRVLNLCVPINTKLSYVHMRKLELEIWEHNLGHDTVLRDFAQCMPSLQTLFYSEHFSKHDRRSPLLRAFVRQSKAMHCLENLRIRESFVVSDSTNLGALCTLMPSLQQIDCRAFHYSQQAYIETIHLCNILRKLAQHARLRKACFPKCWLEGRPKTAKRIETYFLKRGIDLYC